MIRKLTSGTYSYLPLGWRVLLKAMNIVREEMDAKGAQEVLLPAIHPPELWKKTGRYDVLGEVMIKFKDRHGKELILGPTHEEVITDLVANNVRSYKKLPLILYQIQTKFRDEIRPRFGVVRTCEFIMKDAYSFDCDIEGMEASYKKMYDAYCAIFERCGLQYVAVEADPGIMGGGLSHEFMVPAESGEDEIVRCASCGYSASTAVAKMGEKRSAEGGSASGGKAKSAKREKRLPIAEVETPGVTTVEKVSSLLRVGPERLVKTLIYVADGKPVAVLVRGDRDANETKIKNYLKCETLTMADAKTIEDVTGGPLGFSGPVALRGVRIVADLGVKEMSNFVTGANKKDAHLINVNMGRDFETKEFADLRMITKDDMCPNCNKKLAIQHAIEVGHTFKLGTKYSESLGARYLDKDGKEHPMVMGCYGIGVNRIPASLIETSNDKDGILWSSALSPYDIMLTPLNLREEKVAKIADKLYRDLTRKGFEVLYDDRDERAGVKFKDADLLGIPIAIVVGEKNAKADMVEIKLRKDHSVKAVKVGEVAKELKEALAGSRASHVTSHKS
jgi:prolyl-tRNA synthetase